MNAPVIANAEASPVRDRAKVFVSYSRKDQRFAENLVAALDVHGYDAFLDLVDIAPGEPWQARLAGLIAAADTVVFTISPNSVASEICAWELQESERLGKRVIPVVHQRIEVADAPPILSRLNWVFATDPAEFEIAVVKLQRTLDTDIAWVREHTRLGDRARRWEAHGRGGAESLRGTALEAAERWLAVQPKSANAPTELHRLYIAASRRAATRRQRFAVVGALLVALVATGLAALAEINRREAQSQRARAEHTLALATETADGLVVDLAQKFRSLGVPVATIKDILDRARHLQDQLIGGGETAVDLRFGRGLGLRETAMTLLTLGDASAARAAATQARDIYRALSQSHPDNPDIRRAEALSEGVIGDTLMRQGDVDGALRAYRAALAQTNILVAKQDDNVTWQVDRLLYYELIGNALIRKGNLGAALESYRQGLVYRRAMAEVQPANDEWQVNLAKGLMLVGDVVDAQGHPVEALKAFKEALAIWQTLAMRNPDETEWQHQLALGYERIGDAAKALGQPDNALGAYRASLAILQKLAGKDRDNTEWRRSVAVEDNRIGDILLAQHRLEDALAAFRDGMAIIRALAQKDPGNAVWQRDLSIAIGKTGEILKAQGRYEEALAAYREALAIRKSLVAKDPDNTTWQSDVGWSQSKIGDVLGKHGRSDEALAAWREALAVRRTLAARDPANVQWQLDLVLSLQRVADAGVDAVANFETALAILKRLDSGGLLPATKKRWIGVIEADLADAKKN